MVFKNDIFNDVVQSCTEIRKLVDKVQRVINFKVIAFHKLRQCDMGKQGAQEAIFGWYIDKQYELSMAYLSVIINLKDMKSSIQVAGFKEYW